ncbi:MAG TPA: ATP-binding protein [Phaeodactylibacter sp.]|nr:ATP-binding protein [Phaeodactylibacter sp.]
MHDRLALNLGIRIDIAVVEENFEEAYHLTQELNRQHAILDSLDGAFDVEKYYIKSEKKRLESESARQALELRLSKSQRNSAIVIASLAALIALGFLIGLSQQRRSKRKIAKQYRFIQKQAAQLRRLDAAKSHFFDNVSHELRTPLTLIAGPVNSLLKMQPLSPEQKVLLESIRRNGEQLKLLVNDILDLRKLSAGVMEVHRQSTPVYAFFKEHFAQFESKAVEQEIDYRVRIDVAEQVVAELDRAKCRQIANNLLSNAFKFTPYGGQIKVILSIKDQNWLQLSVTDTGIGIAEDELIQIFDRYFQASHTGRTAQGGTGIGLALCKEYVELLGGWVKAESQLGKGSMFYLAFPLTGVSQSMVLESPLTVGESAPRIEEAVHTEASASAAEDSRLSVLIVEDNADLRAFLRFILSQHYTVLEAANGQAALDLLQESQENDTFPTVRLVISDLMMQPVDGYELLSRLKARDETRHLPVIMLTARAGVKDKIKALRIGVDDYLIKPFEEEELLARVSNLLRNQSQRPPSGEAGALSAALPILSQEDMAWLERFEAYVKNNLGNDALTVSFLAEEFSMSESSLLRQVSRITGLTPNQYLTEVRLQAARELLEQRTYRTIARVASAVGYNKPRTFSRNFKERFGQSPSAYLRAD